MFPIALLLLTAVSDTLTFSGRAQRLNVPIPRIEAEITIDGVLDEAAWSQAARLTDFSQYQPVDGRSAEEPTEVLVWYSAHAIHFGIRAREIHGDVVRATRANRDNIGSEDHIQILLDTHNDRRLAYLFGVNPLGVQQDGTRSSQWGGGAGGSSATGGGFGRGNFLDGNVDLNPDYVFESRGHVVPDGYVVEIRIPFKSVRYQSKSVQDWGIQVLRRVQHTGYQDTWTPAVRANSNFLAQGGTLQGLHDMRPGLVLEVTPTVTGRLDGARTAAGAWRYDETGDVGGDARWAINQSLTLNATVNPDFSQVEADVGQVLLNERFALFYPEKRPFFLDGLELFDTPSRLIYTRRIAAPSAGLKLAGKVGNLTLATMLAADDRAMSWNGGQAPIFGITRLRQDLGRTGTIGGVLTTREDGGDYSRLIGADARIYHSRLYYVEVQTAQSFADRNGTSSSGNLFKVDWDRTGRRWGFHHSIEAIDPDFDAAAGFVNRTGVVEASFSNRLSFYGAPGALVQTIGGFLSVGRMWAYDQLGDGLIEGRESISPSATLRGGWQVGTSLARNLYAYDAADYAGYEVLGPSLNLPNFQPFPLPGPERNLWSGSLSVTTPTFRQVSATASVAYGEIPIFREASRGRSLQLNAVVDLRPTSAVRTTMQITRLTLDRQRDGSRFSTETIPRVKLEYQLNRAVFFRLIGEYTAREQAGLATREGQQIYVDRLPAQAETRNEFRMDWLFSYRPTPGTLFYVGYGSTLEEPREFRFRELERRVDGFFAKASYLFRL